MKKSNKQFLKLPEYPGGKEAFKKYIKSNLVYPKGALAKRVEGIVFVIAEIDDNGNVLQIEVEKGIGSGCDEEAGRLIKNIRFGGVKNKGVRVKIKRKFRIEFKLPPEKKVSYSLTPVKAKKAPTESKNNYSYTVNLS